MSTSSTSAISRLVDHHGGFAAVSRLMGGRPPYQTIQQWVARGWASPMHILQLEPHLPDGMSIRDLYADRASAQQAATEKAA